LKTEERKTQKKAAKKDEKLGEETQAAVWVIRPANDMASSGDWRTGNNGADRLIRDNEAESDFNQG
jgi:hypothetical protein